MPSVGLRARITAWYVLLVAVTLTAFSTFIYVRLQGSLISQMDTVLEAASSQALSGLESEGGRLVLGEPGMDYIGEVASLSPGSLVLRDGTAFQVTDATRLAVPLAVGMEVEVEAALSGGRLVALRVDEADSDEVAQGQGPAAPEGPVADEFVFRVVGLDGSVWDGSDGLTSLPFPLPQGPGFVTVRSEDGAWRVHTLELVSSGARPTGWLQTARSLESVEATLGNVRAQLLWGIPLAIVLASLGGLFLADRGLRPIDRITRTAGAITANALSRRIGYRGPDDEVGRLARTFDAMLDRLERAFERERRFTADASHELRTPLTSLKGRIDVTLGRPRSPAEYEDTLRKLDEEVGRLVRLSDELLFLARLDQGRQSWQPEDVDLGHLLGAVVEQVRPLAESRGLALVEEVPGRPIVRGDPDHLIRLFLNLVDNACKHTPAGGRVTVRAEESSGEVRVSVSDTGPGIPPEHIPHLFQRFYRVDESRSRETGGAGLRLAIARELAQLHRGRLEVASQVGIGSTFTVTLPAADGTAI